MEKQSIFEGFHGGIKSAVRRVRGKDGVYKKRNNQWHKTYYRAFFDNWYMFQYFAKLGF